VGVDNPGAVALVAEARVVEVGNLVAEAQAAGVGNPEVAALVAAPGEAEGKVAERAEPSRQIRCRSNNVDGFGLRRLS
jgi:hypothetical protein